MGSAFLASSATCNAFIINVGFVFGAHINCAWLFACLMSMKVLLHKGHMLLVTICLIGLVRPWLLHWCVASRALDLKRSKHVQANLSSF